MFWISVALQIHKYKKIAESYGLILINKILYCSIKTLLKLMKQFSNVVALKLVHHTMIILRKLSKLKILLLEIVHLGRENRAPFKCLHNNNEPHYSLRKEINWRLQWRKMKLLQSGRLNTLRKMIHKTTT